MIAITDLTVRFGGVTSLDGVTVTLESPLTGLIGPNGAGKTTFFNVLSGFVEPSSGSVQVLRTDLLDMTHFKRARWGLRRTFQTEQAIEELSVFDNVAMVWEHAARRSANTRRQDILGAISFVGLDTAPDARVGSLSTHERRLVELARTYRMAP